MAIWEHKGQSYEYTSFYCLPEHAWHHEVTDLAAPGLVVLVIPDATPEDGKFTASPPEEAVLRFDEGTLPWPVWTAFLTAIEETDDLTVSEAKTTGRRG